MRLVNFDLNIKKLLRHIRGGGGGKGGCENVRPENNFSKNREREITFTEIREREIRR